MRVHGTPGLKLTATALLGLGLAAPPVQAANSILVSDGDAFPPGPGALTGGIIAVNPLTGARTAFSSNASPGGNPAALNDPIGIAREVGGTYVVADREAPGGPGGVIRIDPATGARTLVSGTDAPTDVPNFSNPHGIAVEADGDILVADTTAFGGSGGIIRVNPVTGFRSTVSANTNPAGGPELASPRGIAIEEDGDILVADNDAFGGSGGIIRVNPTTGTRTIASSNTTPPGNPTWGDPRAVAIEADGDYVVAGTVAVVRVTRATGARSLLSSNGSPVGGPSFDLLEGIAVDDGGAIMVANDDFIPADAPGNLIRVDPASGARTLVSSNTSPAGAPPFSQPNGIAIGPPVPSAAPRPRPPGAASLAARRAKLKKRRVGVRIACAAGPSCEGKVELRRRRKRIGSAPFFVPAGAIERVRVRIAKPARKALRRKGKLKALATLTTRGEVEGRSGSAPLRLKAKVKRPGRR